MLEIKKKARFITDYYGSAPATGTLQAVLNWIDDKQSQAFLAFGEQAQKKGEEADQALERILSVFHRDKSGNPILGYWMLRRCFIVTGQSIFNAMTDRSHPKRNIIANAILTVEPIPHIPIFNGKKIKKPDGIETYTVTVGSRSFFKAYEKINVGATFDFKVSFDDMLMSEEHIIELVNTAGRFGVGAFRERFGKFEYI